MPEYVYALHDFLPEHEDELPFHAGERIEVVEKDDLYGDGWWQGRNLTGKVGLFPKTYTTPASTESEAAASTSASTSSTTAEAINGNSSSKPLLQPLAEVPESESPAGSAVNIVAPIPKTPAIFHNGNDISDGEYQGNRQRSASTSDGEVMKATMTDVQKAIEQLGRGRGPNGDGDESRSFSFTSSVGDNTEGETDTDFDISDVDGAGDDAGEGWHKGARRKLAAKAKRAIEEAEKLEAMMGNMTNSERRVVAPPIEVELSDESEGEEGDYTTRSKIFTREHPHIPEEDEDVDTDSERVQQDKQRSSEHNTIKRSSTGADSADIIIPERDESESQAPTATGSSFPVFQPPSSHPYANASPVQSSEPLETKSAGLSYPTPVSPVGPRQAEVIVAPTFPEPNHNSEPPHELSGALPSPTDSFPEMPSGASPPREQSKYTSMLSNYTTSPTSSVPQSPDPAYPDQSKYVSMMSTYSTSSTASPTQPPHPTPSISMQTTLVEEKEKKEKTHPNEWSVEEVVEWLRSKGFDQDVCEKFTEQEITGDVLLDLDVNLLKTEIGIMAFGKRMRISNAIAELRRPPSIIYSDQPDPLSPSSMVLAHRSLTPSHSQTQMHSRNQSQAQSHHSYPGTAPYSQSVRSSLGSPLVHANGNGYPGMVSPEGQAQEYPTPETYNVEPEQAGVGMLSNASSPAMNGKAQKGRPAQLTLSPSDGALKRSAHSVPRVSEEGDEDRGPASDGEGTTSMRHRLFGRPHNSPGSNSAPNSRHSKELSPVPPFSDKDKSKEKEKEKDSTTRHSRSRKSVDGGRSGDRLSIFGGTFGGTLGKSRKPAPKYASGHDEPNTDKASLFSMSRLHSTGSRKSASTTQYADLSNGSAKRSPKVKDMTASVSVVKETKEKETRDPALLRKRTSSAPAPPTSVNEAAKIGIVSPLKHGQSILTQIGEPDHSGWMRKRGDRYNSWKMRYFVLKGPHMYCLKSNNNTETKIKGYIHIVGYKVTVDENVNPGRYGFRIDHDHDKTHFFSSDEKTVIRDWMKAIMKATIDRDYSKPVISSCNIPTIPLMVAQAMNPAPRPPSPGARDATQKALRRENPHQLSSRDARVLMGLPSDNDTGEERTRLDSFFSNEGTVGDGSNNSAATPRSSAPPRPSREMRRQSTKRPMSNTAEENTLIEWANTHLPTPLQITDPTGSLCGGLALLRIAESIKGRPSSPPVPDSAFPVDPADDKLDGLFKLFDFLLDHDVKMGSVSINDVRQGKRDKILQLLRALKAWEDKRRAIAQSIGGASSVQAGAFMAPVGLVWS